MPRLWRSLVVSRWGRLIGVLTASVVSGWAYPSSVVFAGAVVVPRAGWVVDSLATPSSFSRGDSVLCEENVGVPEAPCDGYLVTVRNAGAAGTPELHPPESSSGVAELPVVVRDVLPAGLTVRRISFVWTGLPEELAELLTKSFGTADLGSFVCTATPVETTEVQCELPTNLLGFFPLPGVAPDDVITMQIFATVNEPASPGSVSNKVTVEGGGAPTVTATSQNTVEGAAPGFGAANFEAGFAGVDGSADTRAGGHPYELATTIGLNNGFRIPPDSGGSVGDTTVEDVKDVAVDLPVGMLGSAVATPKCTFAELSAHVERFIGGCPSDTIVGHISTMPQNRADAIDGPIYNMAPEKGTAAAFAFVDSLAGTHAIYATVAPSAHGYVLRTVAREIPQVSVTHIAVQFFGVPAVRDKSENRAVALLTNPSQCDEEPLVSTLHMDSWEHPGRLNSDGTPDFSDPRWVASSASAPPVTECDELRFDPRVFHFQPETTAADSPTGASFELELPQPEDPGTLATPPLKSARVTLPVGMIVNPASAGGLASCSPEEIGWAGPGVNDFTSARPSCPSTSQIGSLSIESPLLPGALRGAVYLASENENPFHSLLAGYIVIDDPVTGVVVKIPGKLELNPENGQITGVFAENPQLPFSDLKLKFFGGARGELATPEACGSYSTSALLAPWSALDSGPESSLSDTFAIDAGCVAAFQPTFVAGVESPQAGAFSSFDASFSRRDSESELAGLSISLPPGLLAKLKGVAECSTEQLASASAASAAAELASPSCPASSKVGTVRAGAGVGPDPFFLTGQAYLTGPYKGAPYGLAVVVPALAGPFDLGTVVIRQALFIDPTDAHVTDVSDPLPTILRVRGQDANTDGFPIRLRRVDVSIDKPSFTVNPTNCSELKVSAAFQSTTGASSSASSRFEVGGCKELHFHPRFSASTQARTSKRGGASLRVKVAARAGEANIAKTKVSLPKQLPSRLETLQEACTEQTFEKNPAACPAASKVGTATATTPLLEQPLSGPAYLVSHGGAAFPDLVVVLQGNGITLKLDGKTDIKHGVTTSTFNALPDAPITSFELVLPAGRKSILGAVLPARAHASMCGQHLTMPTLLTGQNGATLEQKTKISISHCPTHHHPTNKHKHRHH
jgi:hypothetical protein